jgi:poly(3-hydroxybutyrate) depolymerase
MLTAFAMLQSGCSSNGSSPTGSGEAHDTGGATSQVGTATGGAQLGTGGAGGNGGALGQGGTIGTGGTTQPVIGGTNGTGGRTGTSMGGTGNGGQLSSGGAGVGGTSNGTGGSTPAGTGGTASSGTGGTTSLGTGGTTKSGTGGTTSSGTGGATKSGTGGTTSSGTGGATKSGTGGTGGTTSTSSAGGTAGGSSASGGAVQSTGCGKTRTLQNGTITLSYNSASRKYILLVPSSYDNSYAYRLVFAFAESGSSAQSVATRNYFTMATYDTKNTIFVAPDAANGAGSWSNTDVGFTDAILAQLEGDLCIDKTRIFATGFSFGAGMAMALACTRADVFRAVAFFSGADLTNSCPTTLTKPIAYYASQASEDANGMSPTNPMTGEMKQAQFAAVNGCTAEPSSTTFPAAGQPHTCTNYKGCSTGHPTEYCVFNGAHGWEPKDPGQSTSWDAPEAWKFITQF